MARILLTHPTPARRLYYGDAAVEGLGALGELRLNEGDGPLDGMRLINAARGRRMREQDAGHAGEGGR